LKQPDDYRQPDASFRDDETVRAFVDQQESPRRQAVERSFETQSGYLVLIKQLGSRYALSFRRQIGTPPSSSIFLTADEAKRLSNMFGSNSQQQPAFPLSAEETQLTIDSLTHTGNRRSPFTILTILFAISVILCSVATILCFETQIRWPTN
jgi:hypothetical protein